MVPLELVWIVGVTIRLQRERRISQTRIAPKLAVILVTSSTTGPSPITYHVATVFGARTARLRAVMEGERDHPDAFHDGYMRAAWPPIQRLAGKHEPSVLPHLCQVGGQGALATWSWRLVFDKRLARCPFDVKPVGETDGPRILS